MLPWVLLLFSYPVSSSANSEGDLQPSWLWSCTLQVHATRGSCTFCFLQSWTAGLDHQGRQTSAYYELLQRIGLGTTLENRRVQDMLITINACFQGTAPTCIKDLVKMRNNKYDLRGNNTLSLPKVNTTKYGLNSFRYFAAKQWNSIPNELRLRAGGLEFNKQVRNIQF